MCGPNPFGQRYSINGFLVTHRSLHKSTLCFSLATPFFYLHLPSYPHPPFPRPKHPSSCWPPQPFSFIHSLHPFSFDWAPWIMMNQALFCFRRFSHSSLTREQIISEFMLTILLTPFLFPNAATKLTMDYFFLGTAGFKAVWQAKIQNTRGKN